jgi:hypothetical protein
MRLWALMVVLSTIYAIASPKKSYNKIILSKFTKFEIKLKTISRQTNRHITYYILLSHN